MARLNIERQIEVEPKRVAFAKEELTKLGYEIVIEKEHQVNFIFKGETVRYWPYSGYHSGKSINDGRGWEHLLKQIKQ